METVAAEKKQTLKITHPVKKKHNVREDKDITRGNSYSIDPRLIHVDFEKSIEEGGNVRVDYGTPEEQEDMKDSIERNGVLQNVKVFIDAEGNKCLRHGYRRMKAVLALIAEGRCQDIKIGFDIVPANEEQGLIEHLVLNNGKQLSLFEQAQTVQRISKLMRVSEIAKLAKIVSMSYQKVQTLLEFSNTAAHDLKETVAKGDLSFNKAVKITKTAKNTREQTEMLDEAKKNAADSADGKIRSKHITGIKETLTVDTRLGLLISTASKKENVDHEFVVRLRGILSMIKGTSTDAEILELFVVQGE